MQANPFADQAQLAVQEDRLLDLAQRLVSIATENPPGNERLAAEFLADYFADLGWAVEMAEAAPGRPNVVARLHRRDAGPHLLFDGHLDVVPAGEGWTTHPYRPEIRNGRLIGRGAADMKGGVAAMIAAAEAVQRAEVPLRGDLTLAVVADEEEGGSGTWHLVQSGVRATWAIVPEPTELRPVIAHKGSANVEIALRGTAAHASTPEAGVNAIDQAAVLLGRLAELRTRLAQQRHPLLGHPTLTVCTINGGFNDYTVPASCRLTLNRRLIPPETEQDVLEQVHTILAECARADAGFRAEVRVSACTPTMETDPDSPVVLGLRSAVEHVVGMDPGVAGWSATCDASILAYAAQIPTVVFGPGSISRDAHRPDESVAVTHLTQCARIFAVAITHLLTEGGNA